MSRAPVACKHVALSTKAERGRGDLSSRQYIETAFGRGRGGGRGVTGRKGKRAHMRFGIPLHCIRVLLDGFRVLSLFEESIPFLAHL